MKLLMRDPWLMAVDKPAGLLSQPGLGPEQSDSVITRLQRQDQSLRLVHRLDRDTSGVLLLARSADALRRLSAIKGIILDKSSLKIVTEYMSKGSLLEYLRSRGRQFVTRKDQIKFAL